MSDDLKIRLQTTYRIRGSSTKRDHADDSLASSPLHNDRDQRRHDSFEHSNDSEPDEPPPAPPQPAEPETPADNPADQNGVGGMLDVEA